MTLADRLAAGLAEARLTVLGGFAVAVDEPGFPPGTRSLLMIGPAEPGFWDHFTQSPEWLDGSANPLDRWSRRVIGRLACDLGGKALFPGVSTATACKVLRELLIALDKGWPGFQV